MISGFFLYRYLKAEEEEKKERQRKKVEVTQLNFNQL